MHNKDNLSTSQNPIFNVATLLLLVAVLGTAVPIRGWHASNGNKPLNQLPDRPRRSQIPSPSPGPAASPTPVVQPSPPAPVATVQAQSGTSAKTLTELQNRIAEVLHKPELAQAIVGVKVASLDTGRVLVEENGMKLLRPASNMKLYTVAAALDRLSPDYRFQTSVYAPAKPDSSGVIRGDLTIYGRGDPSFAARFNNGNYFKAIEDLAARIAGAGVKRVEGDLIGDESYFTGPPYGSGWEWEDLTWYYGAGISALTVNDNALDLFIKPGSEPGSKALITTGPPDPLLTIINQVTTSAKGSRRDLTIYRDLGKDTLIASGSIAVDDRGYTGGVAISHPALLFVYLLRASLAQKGVIVVGKSRVIGAEHQTILTPGTVTISVGSQSSGTLQENQKTELTNVQSVPFSIIAAQTLKPSQNLYTELILRTLGKVTSSPVTSTTPIKTSEDAGLNVVRTFLREAGLTPDSLSLTDGSGLSRNDMVTADATVQLLTFMSKHRYADAFRAALPIAGVDGTLRNRMRGTAAENNVRAKTGSLSSAASLSGYVTSAAGEKLVFSIIVNNYPDDVEPRTTCIDPIAVMLASFTGKSQ